MRGTSVAIAVMILMGSRDAAAQASDYLSSCVGGGVVFTGTPTERITLGVDPPTQATAVGPPEAPEFQVVISCEDQRLVYSSRDGVAVRYHNSGCFGVLSAGSAGQVHFQIPNACTLLDESDFDYAEILRIGVNQVVYRGRVTFWRNPQEPP